jgi:hypothetical protein
MTRFTILGALAAACLSTTASAATLSLVGAGEGSGVVLPDSFAPETTKNFDADDGMNEAPGWSLAAYQALVPAGAGYDGDQVLAFQGDVKDAGNGLSMSTSGQVTLTYLGFEADYTNTLLAGGAAVFANLGAGASAFGATWSGLMGPGLLDLDFLSNIGGLIENDGGVTGVPVPVDIGLAYVLVSATTAFIFLDDSGLGPDRDYDDLIIRVDVVPVPVPAAGLLLAGGLALLGFTARRRA